jgi:hypothetical protein
MITRAKTFGCIEYWKGLENDHSKHEQLFANKMHPIINIIVVHCAHHKPNNNIACNLASFLAL